MNSRAFHCVTVKRTNLCGQGRDFEPLDLDNLISCNSGIDFQLKIQIKSMFSIENSP